MERNYLKKWGEIDIVAVKDDVLHFVEVKSVIRTKSPSGHRPEENVHELKVRRLKRTIATYFAEKHCGIDTKFQFHVITVVMNTQNRRAHVNFLENIIL